ncbi:glutathione S-transferase family protein [Sphingomonas ursincola]|uniref:Glutathione S-transferase family protein n=1 Tax=Sphingomonas ursincola TaxID=56361 RepID=A0A7V8RD12_9SPHN|nr:glutathione S-transferase family protein [Sphingomonas ursincola]MBA1374215.1 glutathione S-transferase family protein [Sphingomonas ursincola]
MSELIFYTNPMSRGQIARWMLEELGAPYEQRIVQYGPEMKGPDYRAINPMGKVPAIVHDGKVITECAAICAYLAEAFPEAGLAPTAEERADYYRWMFFGAGPLEQAIINHAMKWESPEDKQAMLGYGSYELAVETLAGWLADRDYVCGDRFTAADVYVGAQVDWGQAFGTLPPHPVFAAYAERLRARPAYQRGKAIDNELIAKAKAEAEGASA